jgi:hypothetical protein
LAPAAGTRLVVIAEPLHLEQVHFPDLPVPAQSLEISVPAKPPSPGPPPAVLPVAGSPADLTGFTPLDRAIPGLVLPGEADLVKIDTPIGIIAVTTGDMAPPGSTVRLKIVAVAAPPLDRSEVESTRDPVAAAIALIADAEPRLAQQLGQALTVSPSPHLAGEFFILLSGLLKRPRWPETEVRRMLETAGRSDLATRLTELAAPIGRPAQPDRATGEWTVTVLPFLKDASGEPMRLYRHADSDRTAPDDQNGSRFVVEVSLQRLGPLQFDGLVKPKRFDLILRSRQPLDPLLKSTIESVFRDSLQSSGYGGSIAYAATLRFPLAPIAAVPHSIGVTA